MILYIILGAIGVLFALMIWLIVRISRDKKVTSRTLSITKLIFVSTQVAAILWVSISYAIALYSTLKLGQTFPVEELSSQAINTILGGTALKVLENIFEHNDSVWTGKSDKDSTDD